MDSQAYQTAASEAPDYTGLALPAVPRPRAYSVIVMAVSFLALWIAPVVGGDAVVNYVVLGCLAICLWDAPASLFLLIASAGAYFIMPEAGAFKITPTQIVAAGLLVRCGISPGIGGIGAFVGSLNGWVKVLLAVFCVGIYGTAMVRSYLPTAVAVTTGLLVFLVAGTLAMQIRNLRWIVIPVIVGLLLASAYYILIWAHALEAVRSFATSASGGVERVSGGRDDPNYIGTLVAPCFTAFLLLFLCGKGLFRRAVAFLAACLCFMACADTGSRAALVVCVFGGVGAMVLAAKSRGLRAVGGGILLVILGGLFWLVAGELVSGKLSQTVERLSEESSRGEWGMALSWVVSHPVPDPQGWMAATGVAAHQTFLQAGIEGGALGLIGLTGVAIACVILAWRQMKYVTSSNRVWQQAIVLMLITTLAGVCGISDTAHKVMWVLFAVCGLPAHAMGLDTRFGPAPNDQAVTQE